jgi:hypothetical protein
MRIYFLVAKVKHKVVDGEGESEGELGPEVGQAGRDTEIALDSDVLHDTTQQHYYSKHKRIEITLVSHGGFLADLTHLPKGVIGARVTSARGEARSCHISSAP